LDEDLLNLDGLMWLLFMLGPLILIQRTFHKELQSILLLITRRLDVALIIFSILFLPGVLLHELSHYIMAVLLRVRTGRFSIIPRNLGNGRLQLGYVETAKSDIIRDAFIGFAPLVTGGYFVGFVGKNKLGFLTLWDSLGSLNIEIFFLSIKDVFLVPDFWLWFYLTFVISSTMLPSHTDRRAWLPLGLAIILLIGGGIFAGIGPWMMEEIGIPLNNLLRSTSVVFAMSSGIHLIVLLPIIGVRKVLNRMTGLEVLSVTKKEGE
jgi:hypothetical protein